MSDLGHADNVSAFEQQNIFIGSWGGTYNPTNALIKLPNLTTKLTASQGAIDGVTAAFADYATAVNERETAYEGIRPLITRAVQYYESTAADQNKIDDVRTLKRKLDGARAKSKTPTPTPPAGGGTPPPAGGPGTGSASQQGHTQVVEHLDGILELFAADPLYVPNETEIKLVTLLARSAAMKSKNTEVMNRLADISNARGTRNTELYATDTGLYDLAMTVKKYVRAAYGTDSPQYAQINSLKFTNRKS